MAMPFGVAKNTTSHSSRCALSGMGKRQIHMAAQAGKHLADRRSGIGARGDHLQFNLRMHRQQAQQLDPGVACAANDSNFNHHRFH